MWTRQRKKRNTGRLIVPAAAVVFLSYFGFHATHGEYGIYSRYVLEERTADAAERLALVQDERRRLQARVQLLQDGSLEKDMLDEHARRALDFGKASELTILLQRAH